MEESPLAGKPQIHKVDLVPPTTVLNPEKREKWPLSLAEAIAIALENGVVGFTQGNGQNFGQINESLLAWQQIQQNEFQTDSIRVLSMNPSNTGAGIEAAMARFDVKSVTNVNYRYTDQQVQGLSSFNNGQFAHFESGLYKPLATGGVAGITFSNDYSFLANPPTFVQIQNPAYLGDLRFAFDHPLLRGFGTDINQILPRHLLTTTGSNMSQFGLAFLNSHITNSPQGLGAGVGFGSSGILIARLRFDQSRADFERIINYQLVNVEVAYWNLYGAYVNLYAAEQGMRLAHELWQLIKHRVEVGTGLPNEPPPTIYDVHRLEGQFRLFQGDRNAALGDVLDKERILRRLIGVPADDGKQIIPIDAPTLAPYRPSWEVAVEETLTNRPELITARHELKARQLDLILQKNYLLPDLRFVSSYDITGLGSRLDGNGQIFDQSTGIFRTNNALRNMSSTHFNNWTMGLTLNVPLGYRFEHAAVRHSRLGLAQTYMALKNEEKKAVFFLTKAYRDLFTQYQQIKYRRAQRIAFAGKLKEAEAKQKVGQQVAKETDLQSQRDFVNALNQEFQAIVAYNNSLAIFQFAKGTIMQHNNVSIAEGGLPRCAKERAVEHERMRSRALLLRQRANPVQHVPFGPNNCGAMPILPQDIAPSVPSLIEGAKEAEFRSKTTTTKSGQETKTPEGSENGGSLPAMNPYVPSTRSAATLLPQENGQSATPNRGLSGNSIYPATPFTSGPQMPALPAGMNNVPTASLPPNNNQYNGYQPN